MKKRGLGRGLAELLGASAPAGQSVMDIPIGQLEPNPLQPRTQIDQQEIEELASSIRSMGVLQPLIVRPLSNGRYQIVAGERRWRAARRAGLSAVPCIVRSMDDQTVLAAAMIENLQRTDLNPLEAARGYKRLQDEFGLTQEEVARLVGKSRAAVANSMRLLSLPGEVQQMIEAGQLTEGHGRALLPLSNTPGVLVSTAKRAVQEGLSVRQLEGIVRQLSQGEPRSRRPAVVSAIPEPLRQAAEKLQEALATSVRIKTTRGGRGRIEIDFYSAEELWRIIDAICSHSSAE